MPPDDRLFESDRLNAPEPADCFMCSGGSFRPTNRRSLSRRERYKQPMHPMPPAAEFDRFVGDAIGQIRLDPFAVQLSMESMWTIYAMAGIAHVEANGRTWDYNCNAYDGGPVNLQTLLYKRIVSIARSEAEFTFSFDDGATLTVRTELGPYESGCVIAPNLADCFIVF